MQVMEKRKSAQRQEIPSQQRNWIEEFETAASQHPAQSSKEACSPTQTATERCCNATPTQIIAPIAGEIEKILTLKFMLAATTIVLACKLFLILTTPGSAPAVYYTDLPEQVIEVSQ